EGVELPRSQLRMVLADLPTSSPRRAWLKPRASRRRLMRRAKGWSPMTAQVTDTGSEWRVLRHRVRLLPDRVADPLQSFDVPAQGVTLLHPQPQRGFLQQEPTLRPGHFERDRGPVVAADRLESGMGGDGIGRQQLPCLHNAVGGKPLQVLASHAAPSAQGVNLQHRPEYGRLPPTLPGGGVRTPGGSPGLQNR